MTKINIEREEFIRVGTTLYKLVNQPRLNGGYVRKRIPWNAETLRQDYGKGFMTSARAGGVSTYPFIGAPYLREAIRVGNGLPSTALPATCAEAPRPAVGVGRTQHGQEYIPELSESRIPKQRHVQYQRGLP